MEKEKNTFATIDEYIAQYPEERQALMQSIRKVILEEAPEATERVSWQMPTFYLKGNLVHFAMHKAHIGFYPGNSGVESFQDRLTEYKTSKGAIQFPLSKPIPYDLIREIVRFRVKENME